MYHLLRNPNALKKLVNEIDETDKQDRFSQIVTWQEAGKLPYFQACIKEALRETNY